MEILHGLITQIITVPWGAVWESLLIAIPSMMVANSLGMGIGIILTSREIRDHEIRQISKGHIESGRDHSPK